MNLLKKLCALVLVGGLAACGGGGGSAGTTASSTGSSGSTSGTSTTTQTITPAAIEVLAAGNEVLSAGAEVIVTAVVKNVNNVGMADQPVVFSVDAGATLKGVQTQTNDDGVATARLSAGANKALRNVTVTVTSGGASGQITLPVTGTRLALTGAGTIKAGEATTFSARLLDSSGNGISGASINVVSTLGNNLSSVQPTDFNGQTTFIYTANNAGIDALSINGLGASAQASIIVSAIDFVVVSPAANTQVIVNTSQAITVQYRNNGTPVSGQTVLFSTTRGTINVPSAVTDATGRASVIVSSSTAGPASVVAQIGGIGQVSLPIQFVATNPTSLVLQANPGAVLPNSGANSSNQSTVEAVVRDAAGNAVAGRQVNFTVLQDISNGALSPATAVTDSNGRAQVQFIPGATSTPANGVLLQATVANSSVAGTAALTVNGQALFINIAFGNTIANLNETTYSKPFSVYVTDANGNAVGNQNVTLAAVPTIYGKGTLAWNGTVWAPLTYQACINEDQNANGSLNVGEDIDNDGLLKPGNVVVVAPGTVTTNAQGLATFNLNYGEQYVPWVTVRLIARASVGGTESTSSIPFALSGLASDFSNETVSPAGVNSQFGTVLSCTNPN